MAKKSRKRERGSSRSQKLMLVLAAGFAAFGGYTVYQHYSGPPPGQETDPELRKLQVACDSQLNAGTKRFIVKEPTTESSARRERQVISLREPDSDGGGDRAASERRSATTDEVLRLGEKPTDDARARRREKPPEPEDVCLEYLRKRSERVRLAKQGVVPEEEIGRSPPLATGRTSAADPTTPARTNDR